MKNLGAVSLTELLLITDEEDKPSLWGVSKLADLFVSYEKVTT